MKVSKDTVQKEIVTYTNEDVFTLGLTRNEAKVLKILFGKMTGSYLEEAIDAEYDYGDMNRSEYATLLNAAGVHLSDNLIFRIYVDLDGELAD